MFFCIFVLRLLSGKQASSLMEGILRHISYLFNVWAGVVSPLETGILNDVLYEMCVLT